MLNSWLLRHNVNLLSPGVLWFSLYIYVYKKIKSLDVKDAILNIFKVKVRFTNRLFVRLTCLVMSLAYFILV